MRTQALIKKEIKDGEHIDMRGRNLERETFMMRVRKRLSEAVYGKQEPRGSNALELMIQKEREQRLKEETAAAEAKTVND